MMRVIPYICALLLGAGAALVAGCGDRSGLIPRQDADALKTNIAAAKEAVGARQCGASDQALSQARTTVTNLPASVDDRLRRRLLDGLDRLATKAGTECNEPPVTSTTAVPTTTTTAPPPVTTSTTTTTTTTATTEPATTDAAPSTPVDPTATPAPDGGVTPDPSTTGTVPPADPGGVAPVDPGSQTGGG